MGVWVKVCGIRTREALDAALAAGVDAVGFVFATSPREVALSDAQSLAQRARPFAQIVAVMRHPAPTYARHVCERLLPDWLQTDAEDVPTLSLPDAVAVMPVHRDRVPEPPLPERLLFEGAVSGAGEVCDWSQARAAAELTSVVLAGGLSPDNVAQAIRVVRPFGVDVSSGVERRRGEKDPDKIQKFVAAARAAAVEVSKQGDSSC